MASKLKSLPLWQELLLTFALKGLVLALIWAFWFSAPPIHALDAHGVAAQILSSQPHVETPHDADRRAR